VIHLSKSDFKTARECPTKLYYKKKGYPSFKEGNEFMEMLAEGGHLIGCYAQLMYPDGIEIKTEKGTSVALTETKKLLDENENIVLFEAAIESNGKIIRIDILKKTENTFNLIEVKSKSWDSSDKDQGKRIDDSYYEDVAFQVHVLKEAYPGYHVNPFLYMPDKSKYAETDALPGYFTVMRDEQNATKGFKKLEVKFNYTLGSIEHKKIMNSSLMELVDVSGNVAQCEAVISNASAEFLKSLSPDLSKTQAELDTNCFKCEYRVKDEFTPNGFRECFGKLADPSPHISELYHLGSIRDKLRDKYGNQLIGSGKTGLFDVDPEALSKSDGTFGARGTRQLVQIENTRSNREWVSDQMKAELNSWQYPLYFIDFETSTSPLPFHKNMRPYETIAFQWSCHIVRAPGGKPEHHEWINTEQSFPNFEFARKLMQLIGHNGTPLMWATHENTTLRTILDQMDHREHIDEELRLWLESIVKRDKNDDGRFVDMNNFTLRHYFHPDMKGKTSIKKVLPAIWNNNDFLHEIPWFSKYSKFKNGKPISPYDKLMEMMHVEENAETVKDGTGAMRAYLEMMFGSGQNDQKVKDNWKDLLLQYCELDTMAMVIIWTHWMEVVKKK